MNLSMQDLRELLCPASMPSPTSSELAIVIADRGHIWVGTVSRDGDETIVRNGAAVRLWGTTKGLGQLATEGPQKDTKLDPVPLVRIAQRAVIAIVPCKESSWTGKL